MAQKAMVVPRAVFMEVAACHRQETQEPLVLITTERPINSKIDDPTIGKGKDGLAKEWDVDAFVLDMDDSLRLMLGMAKIRAHFGCGIAKVLLDQYGASDGSEESSGEKPPSDTAQ